MHDKAKEEVMLKEADNEKLNEESLQEIPKRNTTR